jgi:hypothetical protein
LLSNLQKIENAIRNKRGNSITSSSPKNAVLADDEKKMTINDNTELNVSRRYSSTAGSNQKKTEFAIMLDGGTLSTIFEDN